MRQEETVFCDGCGVEVLWAPVRSGNHHYCCEDCKNGYECSCGPRMEDDDYPREQGVAAYEGVPGEMSLF